MENSITRLKQGERARIRSLSGGLGFQKKLRTIGIREGKTVKILTVQPLGGPVVVEVDGRATTIGRGMADRIMVESV